LSDERVVELISRSLDLDLNEREQGELDRLIADDPRVVALRTRMATCRRQVGETPSPAATPPLGTRLKAALAALVSQGWTARDVEGRVAAAHAADFQLAMDAAQGRDAAWQRILQNYGPGISALIYQYGFTSEKEDLLQDILLLVCRRIETFRGESSLKTWIFRVSVNHLNNYSERVYGRRKREISESNLGRDDQDQFSLDDMTQDESPLADQALEQKQVRARVFAALSDIAEEIRIAVILRDLNELSYRDIAQIMDIPEGTAKSRVARGRAQLARKLVCRGIVDG
jgi:RNA polymerase sigma-70 factor (ECF subfamily)